MWTAGCYVGPERRCGVDIGCLQWPRPSVVVIPIRSVNRGRAIETERETKERERESAEGGWTEVERSRARERGAAMAVCRVEASGRRGLDSDVHGDLAAG